MKTLKAADLFCGAGGTSTGLIRAVESLGYTAELTAINHWAVAVKTHSANHPNVRHLCASLDSLDPRSLYREGELDLMWASPECTHHSVARGGKPINDQSRATAWCVTRWAEALRPACILVENVQEFETWGPIGSSGRPIASRKGEVFQAWINTLRSLGYKVDWRVLCAADYGDPTTRRRLFIQAVRGRRQVVWPDPTHGADSGDTLFGAGRKPWRPAREIIDWSLKGKSVFMRDRPLSRKTMERIVEGLRRYGGEPFLTKFRQNSGAMPLGKPIDTITAGGRHYGLAEPFLIHMEHGGRVRSVDDPMNTITTAKGGAHALVEPFLLGQQSGAVARPVSQPTPTIATDGAIALVEPFLVKFYNDPRTQHQPVSRPLDSVTTKGRFGLVLPTVEIEGQQYQLDIRFRMLQPHELSAAQGFPSSYKFAGTITEAVKQIGNAVPVNLACAIVRSAVSQQP